MQLLRSNNWEKLLHFILVMHKQPHYEIYYFIISININTYNKTIIFALYISLYHSQSLAYYIHIMYINNACSQNIFFKCN